MSDYGMATNSELYPTQTFRREDFECALNKKLIDLDAVGKQSFIGICNSSTRKVTNFTS